MSASLLLPANAFALDSLETFVVAARSQSFPAREQDATAEQRRWEAQAALGRLLPSITAQGSITHNQVKAELPAGTFPGQTEDLTITPQNQFDAIFRLDVPILDFQAQSRYAQARHNARAEEFQKEATGSNLDSQVAQAYYTYLGAHALVDAAEESLSLANDNLEFVRRQREGGAATELDLARAEANLERARQDVADANLVVITSGRDLETLTGIAPQLVDRFPVDDLHGEAPLVRWLEVSDTPFDKVARERAEAAKASRRAANHALLPTLSASAQERITNATGFAGQAATYSIQGLLTWRLDYSKVADAKAQSAASTAAQVRAEQTRRNVENTIFVAHHRVDTSIAKSRAARAQAESATKAASLAQQGYRAGIQTQLDVTQSQRDALQAQASRIKADADLAYARVLLRVAAGLGVSEQGPPGSEAPAAPAAPTVPRTSMRGQTPSKATSPAEAATPSAPGPAAPENGSPEPPPEGAPSP